MSAAASIALTGGEASYLAELVEQYRELVSQDPSTSDPALDRLHPDPYPDDVAASHEYRRLTRADLLSTRAAEAQRVVDALAAASHPRTLADSGDAAAPAVTVQVEGADLLAWMRTLNGLRLVLATRMGIDDDTPDPPAGPLTDVYEWLGFRLEVLMQSLED